VPVACGDAGDGEDIWLVEEEVGVAVLFDGEDEPFALWVGLGEVRRFEDLYDGEILGGGRVGCAGGLVAAGEQEGEGEQEGNGVCSFGWKMQRHG